MADDSADFFAPVDVSYRDPTRLPWPTADPADEGLDAAALSRAADNLALSAEVRSLLVARHGRLVVERYFNGADAEEARTIASIGKSMLSAATGIAIDEGLLGLDTRIDEFLGPDLVGSHGDLRIEHLLTMSGGLAMSEDALFLSDAVPGTGPAAPSFVREVLKWDSVTPPGTTFAYSTGLTEVLRAVLEEATGQSLCAYMVGRLLDPLGIDVEHWWVQPDGELSGDPTYLTPREIARFGQLVLQGGAWDGVQLVPAAWLGHSLAERWDLGCRPVLAAHQGYGFLWWLYDVEGFEVWNASGYGGQELMIVPDLDLVMVTTHDASNVGDPDRHEVGPIALIRAGIRSTTAAPREPRCSSLELTGYTMRPDGSGRTAIADWPVGGVPQAWSRDGSRLAIQLNGPDLNDEIYALAPDGTGLTRLTRHLGPDVQPALSPDGSRVVFARGDPSTSDLYLVGIDGDRVTQLTDTAGAEHSPTWSPDGSRIAFIWSRDQVSGFGDAGALWAIQSDGTDRALLLDQPVGYPAWSPDGRHIAMELRGEETHIGVLDVVTGALADLGPGLVPDWSPDGTRLVFLRDVDGAVDIHVMRADGTDVVQLTDDDAFDTFPIWSPDGATILFVSAGA